NFLKVSLDDDFNVSIANNGLEAWLMIQKSAPDIIISDVMMPQMDGFELCRHLKSTFETSHIPIILLTALTEKTQQLEGLGLGADDYITKPFDMNLLNQRIRTIVRNREVVRNRVLRMFRQPDDEKQLLMNEQNDQFLKKAIEVVRANIDNSDFGKDEFAAAMFASSSLLYKKIKALTGQSPIEFIKVIRLDYSMELLQSRKYSVTEVSEMCGFSSVGYFSTVFKKHFQRTPTEI
ncbi:MAG: response regulator transcription factor, partial [Paludibacter sp.]